MFMKGFTNTIGNQTIGFANIDTIITIPCGNYSTHNALATAFITEVKAVLDTNRSGDNYADLDITANVSTDFRLACQLSMGDTGVVNMVTGNKVVFNWDEVPRFVCLNVPNGDYSYNTNGTNVLEDEQFNDSYILLGGRRIEEFEGTTASQIYNNSNAKVSLSSIADVSDCHIQSWYPMNNALHTCEYVYITSPQCHSQASNNLVEMSSSHAHKFISSKIIGKAMRVTNPSDGSVFYKIVDQSPFFTNITSSSVSTLIFELRDSRGRLLPYEPPSKTATTTLEAYSGDDQVRDGNTAVDMTLLMEKFVGNAPQKLQGYPAPNPQPNPNMRSNLTIPRKMC